MDGVLYALAYHCHVGDGGYLRVMAWIGRMVEI